jgi:ketosteroid isomerase-like protein
MKNHIVSCSLLALAVSGCTSEKADDTKANVAVVKNMFDAFNRHDWKAMADYYIDSAFFLDPSYGLEYVRQSRGQLVKKYSEMQQLFPDIHDELVGAYLSGDKVTIEFVSSGTSGDGTKFKLPISCILTIKDGKIVKDATYYDQ